MAMVQNKTRRSVLSSPDSYYSHYIHIRTCDGQPRYQSAVSIVICTLDRPESLNVTLRSLTHQTFKNFEVILIKEKGNLSELRQKGLNAAKSPLVAFIDDDVHCKPGWLDAVVRCFKERPGVVGVTGPTSVTEEYRQNRDIFKYTKIKALYDWLFLDGLAWKPSYLSSCGAPSTASNHTGHTNSYEASFLEACNFTVLREAALAVGGFDPGYTITAEWHEVDLALKLRTKGKLWFSRNAKLFHRPSQAGVYKARLATRHRWDNFIRFQRRWVKPSVKAHLYRGFIWTYLRLKEMRVV